MAADRRDRAGLGHAPGLQDRQADRLAVGLRQRLRHGRAAAQDGPQAARVAPLELGQRAHPDRGHAGGDRDALLDDQVGDGRRAEVGPGHHEVGARRRPRRGRGPRRWRGTSARPAGCGRSPARRSPSAIIAAIVCRKRRPVGVHDALGVAGGAARVAHRRGLVLVVDVELRPAGLAEQPLVVVDGDARWRRGTSPLPSSITTRCFTVVKVGSSGHSRPASDRSTKITSSSAWLTM